MTTDEMIEKLNMEDGLTNTVTLSSQEAIAIVAKLRAAEGLAFAMKHRSLPDQQWALEAYERAGGGG